MLYIGIDPGLRGAVAVVGDGYANVWDTPTVRVAKGNEYALAEMVRLIYEAQDQDYKHGGDIDPQIHAMLETGVIVPNKIEGRPDWKGQSARTTAVQWRGIGLWEGILAGLGIPYTLVPPRTWKASYGITADKSEAIVQAQRLFPSAAHLMYRARDDGRAEALLLAEYGRRLLAGART